MRVAIVLPSLHVSGGVAIALRYARELADQGHAIDVLDISGGGFSGWLPIGRANIVSGTPREIQDLNLSYDFAIATFWTTLRHLREGLVKSERVAYLVQGDEENFYPEAEYDVRAAVRETYRGIELKIVVSEWLRTELKTRYWDQQFHLIRNGIDYDKFSLARPLLARGSKLRVVVEGALSSQLKRVRETLAILKAFEGLEVWLVSAEKGSLVGVYPNMSFFCVPYHAMPMIYASCDVLIKNSWTEGFSLPILEMMATGGIAIANRLGPTAELIDHEVNGFIFDSIDERVLSGAFEVFSSRQMDMKSRARETAKRYNWNDQSVQLSQLLVKQLNSENPIMAAF